MRGYLLLIAVTLAAGCSTAPASSSSNSSGARSAGVEAGRRLAADRCAGCHAIGLSGASRLPAAPALRDVAQRHAGADLATVLSEGIATGHPDMPKWMLKSSEIADLVAYLNSIKAKPAA